MTRSADAPRLLWQGFFNSARNFPDRPALDIAGQSYSYAKLLQRAQRISATIQQLASEVDVRNTCTFGYRSCSAFAGVLGALLAGHAYVPLNRTFPNDRTREMLLRSKARIIVVDEASEPQLLQLLPSLPGQYHILLPARDSAAELRTQHPGHVFVAASDFASADSWVAPSVNENSMAYLLFTSGSTGNPKGVMVTHANARHYVNWAVARYGITEVDRCSQTFDMTFDLSVHDMFVTWERGACLCCPSQKQLMKPGAYIRSTQLTTWFSVPSVAVFMRRFGELRPGLYPGLRLVLFCGEALPVETTREWIAAAPNSVIENIYGPTELTIACTAYRIDRATLDAEAHLGVVPIGAPFPGMDAIIVDEHLREVGSEMDGELLMRGPQMSPGYWADAERTARSFVVPPGRNQPYYRTGDRVRRAGAQGPMLYLGRLDNQVKILGHRVELGEVEAAARKHMGVDAVVAIAWPRTPSGADGIELFVEGENNHSGNIIDILRRHLPPYMVPKSVRTLSRLPLNTNGKYDRLALTHILSTEHASTVK